MPRSIFAIRSWCFRIIVTTAITPPTMMATIGTSNPPKPNDAIHGVFQSDPPHGFLVELTGIEPVASWLQTRRSPS